MPSYQGALEKSDGLEYGPFEILKNYKSIYGEKSFSRLNILNVGKFDDIKTQSKDNYNKLLKIIKKGDIILGGDHCITYSLFKSFKKKYPGCSLVVFDCHADTHVLFDFVSHQDWVYYLIKEKIISYKELMIFGVRDLSIQEKKFVVDKKIKIIKYGVDINKKIKDLVDFCKDNKQIYVSFDIDVISPRYAPGTGYRKNGGITPNLAYKLLSLIKDKFDVVGFDLVEVNPKLDKNKKTLKIAAKILDIMIK